MPAPMIADDLAAGRLVHLDMPEANGGDYMHEAIYRTDTPPGPAASWLIGRFLAQSPDTAIIEARSPRSGPGTGPVAPQEEDDREGRNEGN